MALFLGLASTGTMGSVAPQGVPLEARSASFPTPMAVNNTAVTAGLAAPRSAPVGTPINISATVQNKGDSVQRVQVNASANSRFVGSANTTIAANESRSVAVIWETSKFPPGIYNITVAAVPLPGETDLSDNVFQAGTVELLPIGALRVTVSADPPAADVQTSISFRCRVSGGLPPYRYLWDFGDGRTGDIDSPVKAYNSSRDYTVTCTVTDNSSARASASLIVPIAPTPKVLATVDRNSAAPGKTLTFTALATGGTGVITYTWSFGDGTSRIGSPLPHSYEKAGLYVVSVNAADAVGGHDSTSLTISIAPLTVTALQSGTSIRPGDFVFFTAFASGGSGGPYTFIWDFGDQTFGSGPSVSHPYSGEGPYTPSVTVSDGTGDLPKLYLQRIVVASPNTVLGSGPPYFEVGIGVAALVAVAVGTVTAVRRRQRRRRWGPRPR